MKANTVDLRKVYTDLRLEKKLREAHGIEKRPIQDIAEMLREVKMGDEEPIRILLQGEQRNRNETVAA